MMPNKDETGPKGQGPMTGKGGGQCIIPLNTPDEEMKYLKTRKKVLKEELQQVEITRNDLKEQLQQIESRLNEIKKS
jgi:hypothetical protein